MNKRKQYIAPSVTTVKINPESALLINSVFDSNLNQEAGDELYSKGVWESENWSEKEW